jgi:hypothetical protein
MPIKMIHYTIDATASYSKEYGIKRKEEKQLIRFNAIVFFILQCSMKIVLLLQYHIHKVFTAIHVYLSIQLEDVTNKLQKT